MSTSTLVDRDLATATEQGRVCALAASGQRDLQRCASTYPELFPTTPFDPTVFSMVSLATAFGAPWCTAEELRVANRAALWIFAADWLIDYRATSKEQVEVIIDRCLAVADGAPGAEDDPLGRFLADIRDELVAAPAFAANRPLWRAELRRMLAAMSREWTWKFATEWLAGTRVVASDGSAEAAVGDRRDTAAAPTFGEYLDNADNFGSTFVNVSHWLRIGDPDSLARLDDLLVVSREVQRVLRLVNDLATQGRDVGWGDLNALMLTDRAEVDRTIRALIDRCHELLRPLRDELPREVSYLARQIGFSTGFYRLSDFWGSL